MNATTQDLKAGGGRAGVPITDPFNWPILACAEDRLENDMDYCDFDQVVPPLAAAGPDVVSGPAESNT